MGPVASDADARGNQGRLRRARARASAGAAAVRARADTALEQVERARPRSRTLDTAMSTYERDVEHGGGLLAGALAYRFFFWTLPFALILVGAFGLISKSSENAQEWADRLGVLGFASKSIAQAGTDAARAGWLAVVIGLFALYGTSVAFVKALRVTHALVWGVPVERLRGKWRAALFMNGVILALAVALGLEHRLRMVSSSGGLAITLLSVVVIAAGWAAVTWHLPHAARTWHELVPGALVVAVGGQVVHVLTVYYVARKLERASATYGSLGAATAILLSLFFLARVIVAGAALNAHLVERRRRLHVRAEPDQVSAQPPAGAGSPHRTAPERSSVR